MDGLTFKNKNSGWCPDKGNPELLLNQSVQICERRDSGLGGLSASLPQGRVMHLLPPEAVAPTPAGSVLERELSWPQNAPPFLSD